MKRRLLGVLSVFVVAVLGSVLLASPASATSTTAKDYYLALGDSLAFGYQPIDHTDALHQGYVDDLYADLHAGDRKLTLDNLGCPGETTTTMLSGAVCGPQVAEAVAFLRAHRNHTRVVTIDIGANDILRCVHGTTADSACFVSTLGTIASNLTTIMADLRAVAPHVEIVGMTYYDPLLATWLTGPAGQAFATQSVALLGVLNSTLTAVYQSASARIADVAAAFSSTDLTTQVTLPFFGTVPLAVARICQWTWMCDPVFGPDIHANVHGYAVMADTFEGVV